MPQEEDRYKARNLKLVEMKEKTHRGTTPSCFFFGDHSALSRLSLMRWETGQLSKDLSTKGDIKHKRRQDLQSYLKYVWTQLSETLKIIQ